ncbi:MAG: hypothetical protein R3C59_11220 [Planctomycetaceae bacterium]
MSLHRIFTPALIVLVTASLAMACSVPVFRYALEHWRPDSYVAWVFHKGPLTEQQQAVADSLQPKANDGTAQVNMTVKTVDVSGTVEPQLQQLIDAHPADNLPWVVVQSPPKWGPPQTVWQGALTADNAATVMVSPARETIGRRLVDGQSVVWVLLECGRKDEDDASFAVLTEELKRLEAELKLPEIEDEDLKELSVDAGELKIAFSAVRVSRNDPAEQAFVEMLLRIEPDLRDADIINQPMAFPIFGRGRALYALVGKGIAPDTIEEASKFLTGACQCTVKAQNPGVDLIMNVNWDKVVILSEPADEGLPPLAGFSGFGVPDDGAVTSVKLKEPNVSPAKADTAADSADGDHKVAGEITESPSSHATAEPASTAESTTTVELPSSVDSTSSVELPTAATQSPEVVEPGDAMAEALGPNVMLVVMFLVVVTVVATLLFRPKAS